MKREYMCTLQKWDLYNIVLFANLSMCIAINLPSSRTLYLFNQFSIHATYIAKSIYWDEVAVFKIFLRCSQIFGNTFNKINETNNALIKIKLRYLYH